MGKAVAFIGSSNGELAILPGGQVIREESRYDGEQLKPIVMFDLVEWKTAYPGQPLPGHIDILDLGYWLEDGKYEPPEIEWRKEFRKAPKHLELLDGCLSEEHRKAGFTLELDAEDTLYLKRACATVRTWPTAQRVDGPEVRAAADAAMVPCALKLPPGSCPECEFVKEGWCDWPNSVNKVKEV